MKNTLKRSFKRGSHNSVMKALAGFGRSLNRLYENRNHDAYSNGEFTVLQKLSKLKPTLIFDGGANVGKYSRLIREADKEVKIIAFEPVPSTFDILKENLNSFSDIEFVEKGLYKENCPFEINLYSSNTHSSIVDIQGLNYQSTGTTTIDLVRGDDFCSENGIESIDLLKLDLEGVELDALYGFEKMLDAGKIRMVQFEYGYINITTKHLLVDFHKFFESKGYILGKVYPKEVEFREYRHKHEDFIGPNFVAVRKDDKELIDILT